MTQATDQAFYDRADAHIDLANQQIDTLADVGKVSASMTFAASRFSGDRRLRLHGSRAGR